MSIFYYGAATAAFQIEGGVAEGGRGASIWDTMCRRPGAIFTGENADISCDHFHRWEEDIRWLKKLGANAYRFSISWSRILPDGKTVNPQGIEFYQRLCRSLRQNGIEPFVTLYHWDLPQALEDRGGWTNRETVSAFRHYAETVIPALTPDVRHWMTLNEPWCSAVFGYYQGVQAPGRKESPAAVADVIHHLLLAHGYGVRTVRQEGASDSEVGIVLNPVASYPATPSEVDRAACEQCWRDENDWWLEPLYHGEYPIGGWRNLYDARPHIEQGDMALIAEPCDFLGLNLYSAMAVSCDWGAPLGWRADLPAGRPSLGGMPFVPEAIHDTVTKIHEQYQVEKIYIAENGVPGANEVPGLDGMVHDPGRVEYLRLVFEQLERLRRNNVPLAGYFVWTLMDNFEWIWGYSRPFGLISVDFKGNQDRTPKESFYYYRDYIANRRMCETPLEATYSKRQEPVDCL